MLPMSELEYTGIVEKLGDAREALPTPLGGDHAARAAVRVVAPPSGPRAGGVVRDDGRARGSRGSARPGPRDRGAPPRHLDRREGYNAYVMGPPGAGKQTFVLRMLERAALEAPTPSDWCYLNDFADPRRPRRGRAAARPRARAAPRHRPARRGAARRDARRVRERATIAPGSSSSRRSSRRRASARSRRSGAGRSRTASRSCTAHGVRVRAGQGRRGRRAGPVPRAPARGAGAAPARHRRAAGPARRRRSARCRTSSGATASA